MSASAGIRSASHPARVTRLRAWSARSLASMDTDARWVWAAVAAFVLVSVWWLTQDSRVPDFDSGLHMSYAISYHYDLAHGQLTAPWTDYNSYPPLVHLLGALSVFVAGAHPMAMVLSSNIVFVPLLAFGCYGTGKLVAGPRAGLLAALVALGTPMFVSMMHVYDLDPPQAAMVAVTVWALLASRRFERLWISALAGALFGLALLTKETSVVFIAGLLIVMLVRGGWRHWPGLVAFIFTLENVAGPWYMYHASQLVASFTSLGQLAPNSVQAPPRFSVANAGWYFWDLINEQSLAIFGALFVIGALIALWRCVRHRVDATNLYPELLGGALVSYLGMTYLTHKDPRYTLPALVYVAVLATSWIVGISRPAVRRLLTGAVVVLSVVYFAGMSFGIGGAVRLALPGAQNTLIYQRQLTLYETAGWVRGGPVTDGHVLALLEGLRRSGVAAINLNTGANELDFNGNGVTALASSANVYVAPAPLPPGPQNAFLFVHTPRPGDPRPCQTLDDGVGVYVARGDFTGLDPQTLQDPARPAQRFAFVCPA